MSGANIFLKILFGFFGCLAVYSYHVIGEMRRSYCEGDHQ